jgi:LPS-assembly protein
MAWVALVIGLLWPTLLPAQDNKPTPCGSNAESGGLECPDPVQLLDWHPIEAVAAELQDSQCVACEGRYIDPLADVDRSELPEDSDVEANAESSSLHEGIVTLSGGVVVKQGYRELRSDTATLDRGQQRSKLKGNISVREPGILLRGDEAKFNSKTGEAVIQNSQFVLHKQHFRGTAERLRRDEDGNIHLFDGSLSYCAPGDKDWAISATKIELDVEEGMGTARGAKIEVADVPILYLPWLRFPLDDRRRTGILWPAMGTDSKGGVDIALPVYLNLAPNYDALYQPQYIQERGLNNGLEFRYLHPTLGRWSIGGAYMDHDKRYEDEVPEARSHDRWLAAVQHNGLINKRWRSKVDYGKASDIYYFKDLDTSSLNTKRQTNLLQFGSLDYLGDDWLFGMEVQQFQSLVDDIIKNYKKLPQISAQYRQYDTPFEINPIFEAQYSNFDTDLDRVTGERLYAEAGVSYPMMWPYGFLTPKVKYRHLQYDLTERRLFDEDRPSADSALASIDGGLYFERKTQLFGEDLLHTLEPRIFYLYSEYEDQTDHPDFDSTELTFGYNQLFRETRFAGRDRLDDANHAAIGVSTRFIGDADGREIASASLGQIFYFEDRKVRLRPTDQPQETSSSELAAELYFSPSDRFGLRGNLVWDPYSGKVNSGSIQTNYTDDKSRIFNLGYSYRRPIAGSRSAVTEQLHLSAWVPLQSNWSLFASWNYSIEAKTSIEDMVGLEYDTCCWTVRLLHLRYFDTVVGQIPDFNDPQLAREDATQIQIRLKGMGGFGNRVTGLLEDMIRGFDERDY